MEKGFAGCLAAWAEKLPPARLITAPEMLREAEGCTFETSNRVAALLYPESTAEVATIVATANEYRVPLYPVSRGRNWGLGSGVPVSDQNVVVHLKKMNRILEFNDELGYLRLEPGVSFKQATDFLAQEKSQHFLSVTAGPPDGSVVGNYLDRGLGVGPFGVRSASACAAEIVVGTGEIITTGYGAFPGSKSANLAVDGLGISLDGLFQQSNLGIVTALTVWLSRRPSHFESFVATFHSSEDFFASVEEIRHLQADHVLQKASITAWNDYKILSTKTQNPEQESLEQLAKRPEVDIGKVKWAVGGAIYASDKRIARALRKNVRASLRSRAAKTVAISHRRAKLLGFTNSLARKLGTPTLIDDEALKALYWESPFVGHVNTNSIRSAYWRKSKVPDVVDLDRDRCGLYWVIHSIPATGGDVEKAATTATACTLAPGVRAANGLHILQSPISPNGPGDCVRPRSGGCG